MHLVVEFGSQDCSPLREIPDDYSTGFRSCQVSLPEPEALVGCPGQDRAPRYSGASRRRLRYGAPSGVLGRDGVSAEALAKEEALAKSGPTRPTTLRASLPSKMLSMTPLLPARPGSL